MAKLIDFEQFLALFEHSDELTDILCDYKPLTITAISEAFSSEIIDIKAIDSLVRRGCVVGKFATLMILVNTEHIFDRRLDVDVAP